MPLDPFLVPFLETLPGTPPSIDDWPAFRAADDAAANALVGPVIEPGPPVQNVETVVIPVRGGSVTAAVYTPFSDGPHPLHLYLHGGGFVFGSAHTAPVDALCRERKVAADCVTVAVNYRKAPEHQYPTGLADAQDALLWAVDHAEELGIDPSRISIGGGSAGANLAAALTLKLRDEDGPRVMFQLLEVPALDLTFQSPSVQEHATGYGLDLPTLHMLGPLYLADTARAAADPYISPLLAEDLSGLPKTYAMSAEFDPLRDDAPRFVDRLRASGVPASGYLGRGHIHGSGAYTAAMESARRWRQHALTALTAAHQPEAPQ
jgi:acetyl esterase